MGVEITLNDDPELSGCGLTIFCCGCPHACPGCHTPDSWIPENGKLTPIKDLKKKIEDSLPLIKYVCFCGGEFLLYRKALIELADWCKTLKLKTILFTGYDYHAISEDVRETIDVIVDGKYREDLKQIKFPASTNQKVFIKGVSVDPLTLPINQVKP